jgi:hypothetical protein
VRSLLRRGLKKLLQRNRRDQLKVIQYSYTRGDGSFDYGKYKRIQVAGNERKIEHVWVLEDNIAFLAAYINRRVPSPSFGICHGTRRGLEQKWFSKYLGGCRVIGTEISHTAGEFENTIEWDFHDEKPEWIGAVDFVYSNSLDHAYDPKKALTAWVNSLKRNGICIIEHTTSHGADKTSELDPFGASLEIMPFLVLKWSEGAFAVTSILEAPATNKFAPETHFLIIEKCGEHKQTS